MRLNLPHMHPTCNFLANSSAGQSSFLTSLCSDSDCIRECQNGGTLDSGACTCDCAGGFGGANCESECNVIRLASINVVGN